MLQFLQYDKRVKVPFETYLFENDATENIKRFALVQLIRFIPLLPSRILNINILVMQS